MNKAPLSLLPPEDPLLGEEDPLVESLPCLSK